ncbi:hypothetical protein QJQ45_026938 [Haematococcus lacustris]|nr:hypothetical protein QJQ45_026938 [Haematococcus lacustris]
MIEHLPQELWDAFLADAVQPRVKACSPEAGPSGSSLAEDSSDSSLAEDPSDSSSSNKRPPADIGSGLAYERAFQFDPATQMGMGLDPRAIQAVSAASGHLAAGTPGGTSLVAIQRHVAVTLATWDAVWGEYLHPKWAEQRMRLYGAQEKVLERYFKKVGVLMLEEEAAIESQKRWGTRKHLVMFFGNAGIGTRGGWGAKAVLQACLKVVQAQQQQANRQGERHQVAPGHPWGRWQMGGQGLQRSPEPPTGTGEQMAPTGAV